MEGWSMLGAASRWSARHLLLFVAITMLGQGGNGAARGPENHADGRIGTVSVSELPPEARHTLQLVRVGGPFPYVKDGAVFGNREHLLPRRPRGYYREFSVPTTSSRDRGPRRIITGRNGESYYTEDHYRSFKRIIE